MRVAGTLFATAIVLSAPVSRAFILSNVTNSNDLAAGQKICKPRVLKNFLKCAYVQKGDSATWPDLSSCESVLGDCRGWVYHGVNIDELVGRSYLSAAGVSRKANFVGYYAYGNEDPKKYTRFDCNYVSKLYQDVGHCVLGQTTVQGSLTFEDVVDECIESSLSPVQSAFLWAQTEFFRSAPLDFGKITYFYIIPQLLVGDGLSSESCPVLEGYLKSQTTLVRRRKGSAIPIIPMLE